MSNLLDKASIILTPTAYDNGKALCVKPSDGSGDFDFSRNSAATRVNAQGLVENVQILSSNLVQNGDFSEEGVQEVSNGSFSQEGVQLITNGDFATDTDWNKDDSWSISNGTANYNYISGRNMNSSTASLVVGKTYKLVYTLLDYVNGSVENSSAETQIQRNSNGTYIEYFVARFTFLRFRGSLGGEFSIDNVSVREVGQDWTLETGWSIAENKAIQDGTGSGNNGDIIQNASLDASKTYKIVLEVTEYTQGTLYVDTANIDLNINGVGTYTLYFSPSSNFLYIRTRYSNFIGSVTNISVKEVGQNWTLGTGWSIADDKAVAGSLSNGADIRQVGIFQQSKKYKISIDADKISGTNIILRTYNGSFQTIGDLTENSSFIYTTTATNNGTLYIVSNNFIGSITNISVIEITDDTNLPRINYEGFSYQDDLGSEEIVNGGFDTDTAWSKSGSVTIGNGKANFDIVSGGFTRISQNISLTNGKTYKINLEVNTQDAGKQIFIRDTSSGDLGGLQQLINLVDGVTSYTYYFTANANSNAVYIKRQTASGDYSFSIDNVSVKEYLGQEVVPDSGCGSWLFEPQSTNLVTQSETYGSGTFFSGTSGSTIDNTTSVSPSGEANATQVTSTGAGKIQSIALTTLSQNTDYAFSFYAKNVDATAVYSRVLAIGGSGGSGLNTVSYFNELSTENWVRITHYFNTGTHTTFYLFMSNALNSGGTIQLWGAQLEQQSYATSYIPTEGSSVTRNQDVCNNGGSLATINSTEGVLYAEIAINQNDNGTFRLISMTDASDSVRIGFGKKDNDDRWFIKILIGSLNITSQVFYFQEGFQKIAIRYKSGDSGVYINGTKVITNTSNYVNTFIIDNVSFDYNGNSSLPFFGKTKALAVFPYLTDSELQSLTTI